MAGNFWRRPEVEQRWPVEPVLYRTEPGVQILVHSQVPSPQPKGEILIVHGLEGSSLSGYARSMAYEALDRGYAAGRLNLRSCGGTEHLAITNYHAGQTSDVLAVLRQRRAASGHPLFLVGFSLGGNISLKLAGELGDSASDLLSGVCSISAPIDLAACAAALERPQNFIYQRRFVDRLKERIRQSISRPHSDSGTCDPGQGRPAHPLFGLRSSCLRPERSSPTHRARSRRARWIHRAGEPPFLGRSRRARLGRRKWHIENLNNRQPIRVS
jgi:predicted alpha/beta-fold hydrolase